MLPKHPQQPMQSETVAEAVVFSLATCNDLAAAAAGAAMAAETDTMSVLYSSCAVCVSRYGVAIGSTLAPLVRVLMLLCAPITWPLSKVLDLVLGHENVAMKRQQLKAMVQLHGEGAGGWYAVLCCGVLCS